ncbi:MAG: transposase [Oscillospiraceae bacterium]|nr:transposase [Oscillospiraceae bacterium]
MKGSIHNFDTVYSAISNNISNGFVEGINNKVKLIKRVMFGRCRLPLFKSKIILPYYL